MIDGAAHDLMPWISKDQFINDAVDSVSKSYALANVYDPIISKQFNDDKLDLDFDLMWKIPTIKKSITADEVQ